MRITQLLSTLLLLSTTTTASPAPAPWQRTTTQTLVIEHTLTATPVPFTWTITQSAAAMLIPTPTPHTSVGMLVVAHTSTPGAVTYISYELNPSATVVYHYSGPKPTVTFPPELNESEIGDWRTVSELQPTNRWKPGLTMVRVGRRQTN